MIDNNTQPFDREAGWSRLAAASERLATTRSFDEVVAVLRETARAIVGGEGITVVIREGDTCFYAAEDAIGPLWMGRRFPVESCVSGSAMVERRTIAISDIRNDARVPQALYRPTFVRSMVMTPIGRPEPIAAIGAYWSEAREHEPAVLARLEALARSAAIAIENARLLASLRDSDREREMALAAGRLGVWSLDLPSRRLTTSPTCRIIFGGDPEADLSFDALRASIHPDDRERVSVTIMQSIANAIDCDLEMRLVRANGETCWIAIRAKPSYDGDGTPLTLAGVSGDITARKRMEDALRDSAATLEHLVAERTRELIEMQDALRQSQKLEAMGQLTGGVAHDFNNLLTPIIGSLDLLQRRAVGGEREQRLIAGALESADRAKTLVQRLLAFARRQPLTPGAIDIAALLTGMRTLIDTTIGPEIALYLDLAADLPLAHADANQVEMAILNLAVNARDAMPDGGRLTITAQIDRAGPIHRAGLAEGDYILLSVADTGSGMDEATRARAIEPFFSTKGVGRGTGLGLSMAHGLALQLGGALTVSSEVGAGTVIDVWLPTSNITVLAVVSPPEEATPVARSGTALLVDDEDLVRAATADMLTELGFAVVEARTGADALALLNAHDEINVLITDYIMPHMSGAELAHAAMRQRPGLRVLVASGYSDAGGLPPDLPRLQKPFRQADLALHIAAVMQAPRDEATD